MGSDQFCLKWNDYHSSLTAEVSKIRDEDDFFDISLVCGDNIAKAHRLVLSACSPLFRVMLRNSSHPHPIIFLRGIRFRDLKAILNFMYHGEVNVNQEDLQPFLAAAEELRIKGLSQGTNDGKAESCALASALPRDEGRKIRKVPVEPEEESAAPASKKQRTESPVVVTPEPQEPSSPTEPEEQEEQDQDQEQEQDQDQDQDQEQEQEHTLSVKAEFNSTEKSALHNISNSKIDDDDDSNSAHSNLIDCLVQAQNYAFQGLGGNSMHLMSEGKSSPGPPLTPVKFNPPGGGLPYEMHRLGGRNEDGLAHVVVMKTIRGWHCPHCSYVSPSQKGNLKVHILNRHASPGESFGCMFCGKHLSSRSSLQVHISQVHREQNKAKRMLEERMKINNLEDRLKSEMASGILASGTAEALRQARQAEERLKSDMFGLLRNQEERTKEEMVNLLMQQEAGGKEGSLALGSGALSIQAIPNPSATSGSPKEDDLPDSPGFPQGPFPGLPFQGVQGFPIIYPQSPNGNEDD